MGFRSLQHLRNSRSTSRGRCRPATFRLQGLVTLLTVCSLESRAGFVSHRQRSWDSPFGGFASRKVSATFPPGRTHLSLARAFTSTEVPSRPREPRFLGPHLPGAPCDRRRFRPPTTGSSLGFCPSRAIPRRPWPGLLPASSHALRGSDNCLSQPSAPQSLDRPSFGPRRPCTGVRAGGSCPSGVLAPAAILVVRKVPRPGYGIHLALRRTLLSTAQCALGGGSDLP
jgi:hypothetical protein